jgi:hypothetical protein
MLLWPSTRTSGNQSSHVAMPVFTSVDVLPPSVEKNLRDCNEPRKNSVLYINSFASNGLIAIAAPSPQQ